MSGTGILAILKGGKMLYFSSENDFKDQLEHDIEWNESWIKTIEGYPASTSRDEAIKKHKGYITHAQQIYAKRYRNGSGGQKLTLIRGGIA